MTKLFELGSEFGSDAGIAAAIKSLREELDKLQTPKEIKAIRDLADQSKAAQLKKLSDEMASVRDNMEKGRITAKEYAGAMEVLSERMKTLEDNASKVAKEMETALSPLERAIDDTIGSSLVAAMEGNFKNIGDLWKQLIQRMIAQALQAQITRALFGNSEGGLWQNVIGAVVGGGGENTKSTSSGKSGAVIINYGGMNFGSDVSRNEVVAAMKQATARAKADIAEQQRRGVTAR
jgi:hypothetical protein